MRKSFRGNKPQNTIKEFRANERIFATKLMVIDEKGQQLGILDKVDAMAQAKDRGLDLVEVSPKADPPIAKYMNFGSYKYQKEKQERKAKAKNKTIEIKTIKISTRISQHDIEFRINQALKFLKAGDKVKIELQLRGREHQHVDLAKETIQKSINEIGKKLENQTLKTEQPVTKLGSKLSAVIAV